MTVALCVPEQEEHDPIGPVHELSHLHAQRGKSGRRRGA